MVYRGPLTQPLFFEPGNDQSPNGMTCMVFVSSQLMYMHTLDHIEGLHMSVQTYFNSDMNLSWNYIIYI